MHTKNACVVYIVTVWCTLILKAAARTKRHAARWAQLPQHTVSGVLCDRRMKVKIKGKVYKTIVRPAMVYGAQTRAVKKAHEKKMEVAEMKMLQWMCVVTRLDKIRNKKIRETTKVGEMSKKVQ